MPVQPVDMPDTVTLAGCRAVVVQRWAQCRTHAQNARLTKRRVQAVQCAGQLQHRTHRDRAGVFRLQLGRADHKLVAGARCHIQLVARVHQAHGAQQGNTCTFNPQHLPAHTAQGWQPSLAAHTACVHSHVYSMCLTRAYDGLRLNTLDGLAFMPLHTQAVQLHGQRCHQLVIGQLSFACQVQPPFETPGQRGFKQRQCCRIQRFHLGLASRWQLVVQQPAEVFK